MFRFILIVLAFTSTGLAAHAQPDQIQIEPAYLQRESQDMPVGEPATSIFFTFDDGPATGVTMGVAAVLADYDALGTFFAVGRSSRTENGRRILGRLVAQGHLIANHTYEHSQNYNSEAAFEASLRRTSAALEDYYPSSGLIFFRSPFGTWNRFRTRWTNMSQSGGRDAEFASYVGPIRWNAGGSTAYSGDRITNAADWHCWSRNISVETCARGYLRRIRSNYAKGDPSLVLMHDLSQRTAQMLRIILRELESDGIDYQYKRLDQARWPMGWVES